MGRKTYIIVLVLVESVKKIKKRSRVIISLVIGIILPWLLTLYFLFLLNLIHGLSEEVIEDPILIFRITIFYAFNLTYEFPILGNGFWPCLILWAITGFLIGLVIQKKRKSLSLAMISVLVNFLIYLILIPFTSFPNDMIIDPLISPNLYSEFVPFTPFYLLFHISFSSFILPIVILFALIGSILNPKKPYPMIFTEAEVEAENKVIIEKKKKLRGFPGSILKQLEPLNNKERFKLKFKNTSLKFLLNPIDQLKAALIIVDKGKLYVEGFKKEAPLMKMDKKEIGFNAMLQVPTKILLDIAMGKMSNIELLKVARKDKNIKVKGKLKLLKLSKMFAMLEN